MGMRSVRVVGAMLAAVSLAGCWEQVGFNAGHTRYNDAETALTAANVGTLSQTWAVDVGTSAGEPIYRGGRVYVAKGGVDGVSVSAGAVALAADSGAVAWDRTLSYFCCAGPSDQRTASFTPTVVVGDEVWMTYTTAVIRSIGIPLHFEAAAPARLGAADGSVVEESSFFALPIVAAGDRVVVSELDGNGQTTIDVRDKATNTTQWSAQVPPGQSSSWYVDAPAVADGWIFVASRSNVSAYSLAGCGAATCAPSWSTDLAATPRTLATAAGGTSIFTIVGNDLVAIDRGTGAVSWQAPLGATAPAVAIAGDTVYAAAGTNLSTFAAAGCGAATCAPTSTTALAGTATTAPTVAGDVAYVGSAGIVQAFGTASCGGGSCAVLNAVVVADTPNSLSIAGGRLFVASRDGTVTAFAPAA